MKRHNFHGKPDSHGTERKHRSTGSVGAGTTPGRVFKGMKGPGRLGGDRTTILSLEVVESDVERNLLLIKGALPGNNGGLVMIRNSVKKGAKA
jgi:large subunit ribosomal protein L3